MTIGEFKAFIEGMGVQPSDCPTKDQWERVMEKIDALESNVAPVINNVTLPPSITELGMPPRSAGGFKP